MSPLLSSVSMPALKYISVTREKTVSVNQKSQVLLAKLFNRMGKVTLNLSL